MEKWNNQKEMLKALVDGIWKFRRKNPLNAFVAAFADDILKEIKSGCFERINVENHHDTVEVNLYCTVGTGSSVIFDKDGNVTGLGSFREEDDGVLDLLKDVEKRGLL